MEYGLSAFDDLDHGQVGLLLVGFAVVGLALVFAVSAVTAPTRGIVGQGESVTIVGVQGGGVGWHEHGQVQLRDERGRTVWQIDNADSYFDVTATENGTIMAGFMHGGYTSGCESYNSPCTKTGFRLLDPNASDPTVYEHSFPVRTAKNSEVHDVERLPSGEYLVSDMDRERIYTVWKNGTESWEWRASNVYTPPSDPTKRDWLHINDIDTISEDRYLVSVRNANQLLIIERGTGVVDVINRDESPDDDDSCTQFGTQLVGDDPRCGDPDIMDHQHNPQWLSDSAVLVADSDNNRVIELHRNGSDGDWFVAWQITSVNGIELSWPRDADRLENGNTLITDTLNKRILEVTESGEAVWSTTFNHHPYEADRLPEGETTGGTIYNPGTGQVEKETGSGHIPVLTPALSILQTSLPLPFWVSEWHLLAVLVATGMSIIGTGLWVRDRRSAVSAPTR